MKNKLLLLLYFVSVSAFAQTYSVTSNSENSLACTGTPAAPTTTTASVSSVCAGTAFSVTASGCPTGATYAWYDNAAGTGAALSTANPLNVSAGNSVAGNTYYAFCVCSGPPVTNSATGKIAPITIYAAPPAPTTVTSSLASICPGGTSTVKVSGCPGGATYAWYTNSAGTGSPISTATTLPSAAITAAAVGTQFYAFCKCGTTQGAVGKVAPLTINPIPAAPTATTNQTICKYVKTPSTLTGTCPSGSTYKVYTANTGTTLAPTSFQFTAPTTTYYGACVSSSGCISSTRVPVTVNVMPYVAFPGIPTATASSICSGSSVTIKGVANNCPTGTTSKVYTSPLAPATSANGITPYFSGLSTSTFLTDSPTATTTYYHYCVNNSADGCYTQFNQIKKVTVTVTTTPGAPTNVTDKTVCGRISSTLKATCPKGSTPVWSTSSTGTPVIGATVYPAATTTYYVRCKSGTCYSSSATSTVTVTPKPTAPTFTSRLVYGCRGSATDLATDVTCSSGTPTLYTGGALSSALPSTIISPSTLTRWYFLRCANGSCVGPAKLRALVIRPVPAAPVIRVSKTTICAGLTTRLRAAGCYKGSITWTPNPATPNTGAISTWVIPGNIYDITGVNNTTSDITTTYTATCTINGCTSSKTIDITVKPAPAGPYWSVSDNELCAGQTSTLTMVGCSNTVTFIANTANSISGLNTNGNVPIGIVSPVISPSAASYTSGVATKTVTPTATTTYQAYCGNVPVSTCGGSSSTSSETVTVSAAMSAPAITRTTVSTCPINTYTLTSNCPSGTTSTWSNGDEGSPITVISSPDAAQSIYLVCQDASGCTSAESPVNTIPIAPVPSDGPTLVTASSTNICSGETVRLGTDSPTSTTVTSTCPSGTVPRWYTSSTPQAGSYIANAGYVDVTPTSTTTYYMACVVSAADCPVNVEEITINVSSTSSGPTNSSVSPSTICNDGAAVLLDGTCPSGTEIVWYDSNPSSGTAVALSSNNVNPSATTTYYSTCTNGDCESVATPVTVTVVANATPDAPTTTDANLCPDTPINLTSLASCASGTTLEIYTASDLSGSTVTSVTPTASTTYYAVCKNGCYSAISTIDITTPDLSSTVTSNSPSCVVSGTTGAVIQLSATDNGTGNTYSWSGPNGFLADGQNVTNNFTSTAENGTYTLTVTDADGVCTKTYTTTVACPAALYVSLLDFKGKVAENSILLNWVTGQEVNADKFVVLKSNNAQIFYEIGELAAAGNSKSALSYSFNDVSPNTGINYYRLKSLDLDKTFQLSNILAVKFNEVIRLKVAPNPVSGTSFTLNGITDNFHSLELINIYGKAMPVNYTAYPGLIEINIQNSLSKGIYLLKVINKNSNLEVHKVVVE